jgi:hypothetical protein
LLNSLGPSAEVISTQVGGLQEGSLDKLKRLRSAYTVPTASLTRYQAAADRASDIPPFGYNPSPSDAFSNLAPAVRGTYYREEVAPHRTANDPFTALLDRFTMRGQILAMAIHRRHDLRMAVERIAVGRVLPDGRNDGTITIEAGRRAGMQSSAMTGERVAQMADGVPPEMLRQFMEIYYGQTAFGPFGLFASGMAGSFDSSSLDGSGSSDGSAFGPIGSFDGTGGLDTEILKLKRMIDKRSHATDLYSQTLTAYNNAAKAIIEKMRA